VGRIRGSDREGSGVLVKLTVHAVVDRVDASRNRQGLALGAETEPQHRLEGAVKASCAPPRLAAKRAVIGDALRHQRMRELEQDGRAPGQKQDNFFLEPPGHGLGAGNYHS